MRVNLKEAELEKLVGLPNFMKILDEAWRYSHIEALEFLGYKPNEPRYATLCNQRRDEWVNKALNKFQSDPQARARGVPYVPDPNLRMKLRKAYH